MAERVLWITAAQKQQMAAHVSQQAPLEACGLVAGQGNQALQVMAVTNSRHSPRRFLMDPQEQVTAFIEIDANGWELLGIYHSHPQGPDHPSETDLAEAAYPEAVNIIWYRRQGDWQCRGFLIRQGEFEEIPILIKNEK